MIFIIRFFEVLTPQIVASAEAGSRRFDGATERIPGVVHARLEIFPSVVTGLFQLFELVGGSVLHRAQLFNLLVILQLRIRFSRVCLGFELVDVRSPLVKLALKFLFLRVFHAHV